MSACLDQIVEINKAQIDELLEVSKRHPDPDNQESCVAFSRQVTLVESAIVNGFALTAQSCKKSTDLAEIAESWARMSCVCENALKVLLSLKDRYVYCGTPQLYDQVLDYKIACDERHGGVMEEITWQNHQFPEGLFPTTA